MQCAVTRRSIGIIGQRPCQLSQYDNATAKRLQIHHKPNLARQRALVRSRRFHTPSKCENAIAGRDVQLRKRVRLAAELHPVLQADAAAFLCAAAVRLLALQPRVYSGKASVASIHHK
jgi:hypothetical protein